ncbi:MAG: mono/diheme cytochrome c family protein [Rhodothermales bacterium]|jgi:mono/diheme cytochrome c family protein
MRGLLLLLIVLSPAQAAISYDEHIKPIFRRHCLKCHGDDTHKADLNLQTYASALKGGSGGAALIAGRTSQSLLHSAITDADPEARMPPKKPQLPAEHVATIAEWIASGLRESSASASLVASRDTRFQPPKDTGAKPEDPAMPGLPPYTPPATIRPLPILAIDASPWAPVVAVAGHEHVRLIHTKSEQELGAIPFPDGVPQVIRFSSDGALLLVAGGRPVESGIVALFSVKTGQRLATIGDEIDAVLAADISPDQTRVALGGSGKRVKVYATSDASLSYSIDRHTDWITALAFSPDGSKLASSDRAGGIHIWDASSGGILLNLGEHKAAVRALDWRSDSKFLASVGEDGRVIWWDVADGWPAINKDNAHPPPRPAGSYGTIPNGVLAAHFAPNGQLATTGRDGVLRLWDEKGNAKKTQAIPSGLPISVTVSHDSGTIITGDSTGKITFLRLAP